LEKDLYAVLGVATDADSKTIRRAYRQLARDLHPDTHPDDPEAAERFKEVTAAYDVIGDSAKRAEYDEFRHAVAGARAADSAGFRADGDPWTRFPPGDFSGRDGPSWTFDASTWTTFEGAGIDDLFADVLRGARQPSSAPLRGADVEAVLDLDFEDAVRGLTTDMTLTGPDGLHTFKVRVPAGVDNGQRIRLAGKGSEGVNGGPPGDLYVHLRVIPHPVFGRQGRDLKVEAPITWPQAVLGTEIDVPTLDGPSVRVRVPPGTPHGRTLRVRGLGVATAKGTGDLLVGIRVTVPEQLTDAQKRAVEAVAEAFDAGVAAA
jgi:molecular chaperone DnaJ